MAVNKKDNINKRCEYIAFDFDRVAQRQLFLDLPEYALYNYLNYRFIEGLLVGNGEVILVLEDVEVLKLAKIMLENLGCFVLTAGTPNQAMAAAEEHGGGIDLLITDVIMPEMNGKDFTNQLKTLYPDIKILFYKRAGRHGPGSAELTAVSLICIT